MNKHIARVLIKGYKIAAIAAMHSYQGARGKIYNNMSTSVSS